MAEASSATGAAAFALTGLSPSTWRRVMTSGKTPHGPNMLETRSNLGKRLEVAVPCS